MSCPLASGYCSARIWQFSRGRRAGGVGAVGWFHCCRGWTLPVLRPCRPACGSSKLSWTFLQLKCPSEPKRSSSSPNGPPCFQRRCSIMYFPQVRVRVRVSSQGDPCGTSTGSCPLCRASPPVCPQHGAQHRFGQKSSPGIWLGPRHLPDLITCHLAGS